MDLEKIALESVERNTDRLVAIGKGIWEHAELGLQEKYAADLQCAELEKHGFTIQRGIGQQPSAFVASWGAGKPIIGFLGEYDALAGLSQKVQFNKEPLTEGAPGHGCGHNLLGTGAMGAAVAVKEAAERAGLPGTIRYYGCPAEETLIGKVFMARDGVFNDMDVCFNWHPMNVNSTNRTSSTAMNSFKVHFHGVAAHGAAAPHMGKSALDGCVLMDVGVQYLREHIEQECRIHCVITDGGGAPNIVPPQATIWYYCRAPKREMVDRIYARMLDIAKGAALMSDTTYDVEVLTACHELLVNHVLSDVIQEKMLKLGGPGFTEAEKKFAAELQKQIPPEILEAGIASTLAQSDSSVTRADLADAASDAVLAPARSGPGMAGSTDVGDVSKIAPTSWLTTSTWPIGTPAHSWQAVVASGSDMGARAMIFATKAMAMAAVEFLAKPELVAAAKDEFAKATAGKPYVCALPAEAWPHF